MSVHRERQRVKRLASTELPEGLFFAGLQTAVPAFLVQVCLPVLPHTAAYLVYKHRSDRPREPTLFAYKL